MSNRRFKRLKFIWKYFTYIDLKKYFRETCLIINRRSNILQENSFDRTWPLRKYRRKLFVVPYVVIRIDFKQIFSQFSIFDDLS